MIYKKDKKQVHTKYICDLTGECFHKLESSTFGNIVVSHKAKEYFPEDMREDCAEILSSLMGEYSKLISVKPTREACLEMVQNLYQGTWLFYRERYDCKIDYFSLDYDECSIIAHIQKMDAGTNVVVFHNGKKIKVFVVKNEVEWLGLA